jgi:peroxiredoxin (alkyl hydroperoxide reductase subunit C)
LQARLEDFRGLGAELVAVSSSPVEEHRALAEKLASGGDAGAPGLTILADVEGEAIRAYGLIHPDALPFTDTPIARPAVFLVDGEGVIRARFLTDNWVVRPRPEQLLGKLKELQAR